MSFGVVFIVGIVVLACFIPAIQILINVIVLKKRSSQKICYFSEELFDFDLDSLSFETLIDRSLSRTVLYDRGWVRMPNGTIITNDILEKKKQEEYQIALP